MSNGIADLGAQDPELENSPVAWEGDEGTDTLRESVPGEPVCFFNGRAFSHGAVISSGGVFLRCDYGLWVPSERAW